MLCQLTTMPTASSKFDDHVVNENIRLMDTRNPIMIPMTGRLADWRLDEQSTIFGGFIWRYPGETKYCLPKSPSLSALSWCSKTLPFCFPWTLEITLAIYQYAKKHRLLTQEKIRRMSQTQASWHNMVVVRGWDSEYWGVIMMVLMKMLIPRGVGKFVFPIWDAYVKCQRDRVACKQVYK